MSHSTLPPTLVLIPRAASLIAIVLITASLAHAQGTAEPATERAVEAAANARASLPLDDVLELYRQRDQRLERQPRPAPPVAATVDRLELRGRLLDRGVELTGRVQVTVLAPPDDGWATVPLLELGAGTHLTKLPNLEHAALSRVDDRLFFMSRRAGTYGFEIGLLETASVTGERRRATIDIASTTLASLQLEVAGDLFRLDNAGAIRTSDGYLLHPDNERYQLAWSRRRDAPPPSQVADAEPVEPLVTEATASVVSTLEGEAIVRVLYRLRVAQPTPIHLELPPANRLERVYRNGISSEFEAEPNDDGRLELEIVAEPSRAGDPHGTIELVLARDLGGFLLAGDLLFTFPSLSWPVDRLTVTSHLPQVFNYTWNGGSLSPTGDARGVDYTYDLPTPGKAMTADQTLIFGSHPTLRLSYTIDLEGRYYQG